MWCIVMQAANALKMFARAWIPAVGLLAAAGLGEALAGGGAGPREVGLWIDDTGKGAVRIEPCGNKLCGRIAWLKEPLNAEGQPRIDKNNPDPAKQSRPICGLPILGQLGPLPEGGYDGGWVYDPKVGKSYDVAIELTGPNRLQVTGYKGVRFLGKSFVWTRAASELAPCDAQSAATVVLRGAAQRRQGDSRQAADCSCERRPSGKTFVCQRTASGRRREDTGRDRSKDVRDGGRQADGDLQGVIDGRRKSDSVEGDGVRRIALGKKADAWRVWKGC